MTITANCGTCPWQALESPRITIGPTGKDGHVDVEALARQHHEEKGHVVVIVNAETGELISLPPDSDPSRQLP